MKQLDIKYKEKYKEVLNEINQLQAKLEKHQQSEKNWTHIGDLNNVLERLKELNKFIS